MEKHLKERMISALWSEFIAKIESEWSWKYQGYGNDLSTVKGPINFAKALQQDIIAKFRNSDSKQQVVNHLTIYNYFKLGGFPIDAKVSTLDIFSQYLGYKGWKDFINRNEENINPGPLGNSGNPTWKHRISMPVLLFFLLIILAMMFQLLKEKYHSKDAIQITQRIHDATNLEFSLYKAVPNLSDTMRLNNYFTANGSAKQTILGNLDRAVRNNRKLRLPNSLYEILQINVEWIRDGKAFVKTEERWYILWYRSSANQDERLYDHTNNQTYYLVKEGEDWKIHSNDYKGQASLFIK